jgi:UDP-N-acetylmuramoyl-tripeptide--D-alanyl-D-alanine ligase
MRDILETFLGWLSKKVLKKYKPQIIAVTGSVGKTSTREAVYAVVSQRFLARKSSKNFNDLLGLPLTILGATDYPGKNIIKWLKIIGGGFFLILIKQKYPKVLVLEMGIDKPGEMDKLVNIAKPNIAILTRIGEAHYEFFKSFEVIATEKAKIGSNLTTQDNFLFNAEDEAVVKAAELSHANKIGVATSANVGAKVYVSHLEEELSSPFKTHVVIVTPEKEYKVSLPALGKTHVQAAVFAVAVGSLLKIETDLIQQGLNNYRPFPGRLNILPGIKHSVLIDDTYNASPEAMEEAIALLVRIPGAKKMAVLGDMLELGSISDDSHMQIGKRIAGTDINRLVVVGAQGKLIGRGAVDAGFPAEQVVYFDSSDNARVPVQDMIEPDMVVLIKGSQGVRMEKITKEIMAEPMKAHLLLPRQYGKWLKL